MWLGIDRGPDTRTPQQKAAAENIEIGHPAEPGGLYVFRCRECGERDLLPRFKHKPSCETGKVLEGIDKLSSQTDT
jgi:hypothetical protein